MSVDRTAASAPTSLPTASAAEFGATPRSLLRRAVSTLSKNVLILGGLAGAFYAIETGYFSNDRTSRREWNELERLKEKGKPIAVYEADFRNIKIDGSASPAGYWDFYNGATADTVSVENGELVLTYTTAWIGSEFRHTAFTAGTVYRLSFEAKVDGEAAAVLMRNRQLDLMRESIPVTDGAYKTFEYFYVSPNGRWDRVRLIFMPDNRGTPKGRMTVRKFKIERFEG